tara:strand:+ start:94 stop:285 length:192 start_codon:yes stop_codon:yes gene_type:complete
MNSVILGFYLVVVSILPNGNIDGKVLDYFEDPMDCVLEGQFLEASSEFGIGYVCIEDVVKNEQ